MSVIVVQKTEDCAFVRSFVYLVDMLSHGGNSIVAVSHMFCHLCVLCMCFVVLRLVLYVVCDLHTQLGCLRFQLIALHL